MKSPRRVLHTGPSALFNAPGRARTRSAWLRSAALALAVSALSLGAQGCAHHHPHGHHHHHGGGRGMPGLSGVSVVGVGEVKAAPDIARTNVGVEARAPQAEQAVAEVNQRMAAVIAALKAAGVEGSDLRTHSLSINFEREYQPTPPPMPVEAPRAPGKAAATAQIAVAPAPQPEGFYRVSNMVEVTVRNLDRISQVLEAATSAGINQMWGITFEVADPSPLITEARAKAVEKAKQNAEQLQQLTGVALGPIVSITDGAVSQGPMPMFAARAEMANTSMPVERGELTVTHQVTILYGLAGEGGAACEHHKHEKHASE